MSDPNTKTVSAEDVYAAPWETGGEQTSAEADANNQKLMGLFEQTEDPGDDPEAPKDTDEPAPAKKAEEPESDEDDDKDDGDDDDSADDPDDPDDEGKDPDGDEDEGSDEGETWELPDKSGEKVTREEALLGYLRTKDYTRKTQAVAEERRSVEAEKAEVRGAREQYLGRLKAVDAALAEQQGPQIDWDKLQAENPEEFAVRWAEHDRVQKKREAVFNEHQRVAAEHETDAKATRDAHILRERELLHAAVPEWEDEEVRKAEKAELYNHALERGFTAQQLEQVESHAVFLLLRDAMLYQKGQKKTAEVAEVVKAKVKEGTKPVRPGVKAGPGKKSKAAQKRISQARERLAQSGSVEDAAAMFFEMIDD